MPFSTTFELNWEVLEGAAVTGSSPAIPWEVLEGAAISGSVQVNWEVLEGTAFSGSVAINWEVLEPTASGGDPNSILNLPAHAVASRLRADFHSWGVTFLGHTHTREVIGAKVGSGSVLSIDSFKYTYPLDGVGDWEMTIPANDPHAAYIIDGTAKVLKLYYEGVGLVFIGMVEDYFINDSEVMTITGVDFMGVLARKNSLWRINLENYYAKVRAVYWYQIYNRVLGDARYPYRYEVMPTQPAWIGTMNDFVGVQPKFQSQSLVEILVDLYKTSGVHFRIQPNQEMITLGEFGDDSGIIIAPVQEDDPLVREQGALILRSINYVKSKEELVNMIVPQGSNDSFGIAVELKHSNYVYGIHVPWVAPSQSTFGLQSRFDSTNSAEQLQEDSSRGFTAAWQNLTVKQRSQYPLDLIPKSLLEGIWEDYLNPPNDGSGGSSLLFGGSYYAGTANTHVIEVGGQVAAVAIGFTPNKDFYPTVVSFMNIGGIGTWGISIVDDVAGDPDTSNLFGGLLQLRNYPFGAPGQKVRRPSSSNESSPGLIHITPRGVSANLDQSVIEYGTINEISSFMERHWEMDPPWPLLQSGTQYWVVLWVYGTKLASGLFQTPGNPLRISFGDPNPLRILRCVQGVANQYACRYHNGVDWVPTTDIVCSIYGWSPDDIDEIPYAVEGMTARSIDDNGTGHRVFYIRDFDSISEHGLRQASVSFETAIDAADGIDGVVPAANSLLLQSMRYLENHKDPFEKITLTVTGAFRLPYVGQKVRVVYRGLAKGENGFNKFVDINGDYFVLSINWDISNEEIQHTFTFASKPQDIIDPDRNLLGIAATTLRTRHYFGELQTAGRRVGDGA